MNPDRTDAQPDPGSLPDPPRRRRVKVVGYDGSADGRNVVASAARRVGSGDRMIIVHVLEPRFAGADPATRYHQVCEKLIDELDLSILDGIDYELRVVDGRPAQALIDVALHTQAVAIVIGTRRAPSRLGQRTIRSELEAGPVPVVALVVAAERERHQLTEPIDMTYRHGYDSFPASDPPSSWSGPANGAPARNRATSVAQP
jgi:nucleotide-binding universal stress UspA family protein